MQLTVNVLVSFLISLFICFVYVKVMEQYRVNCSMIDRMRLVKFDIKSMKLVKTGEKKGEIPRYSSSDYGGSSYSRDRHASHSDSHSAGHSASHSSHSAGHSSHSSGGGGGHRF